MTVLSATGAGVRHHRRWLLRDLDLVIDAGETVAVVGPPGSGRTSTLLALAGRLRLSSGRVSRSGATALGHVSGVNDPEPVFTVREHVRERLALLGRSQREADGVDLHGLDPGLQGRELTPYQKQVLGLVLARLGEPALIALDGADSGLDSGEQAALWEQLAGLAAEGVSVLVTARAVDPGRVSRVVLLSDPQSGEPGHVVVQESPPPVDEVPPLDEVPTEDEVPAVAETVVDDEPSTAETARPHDEPTTAEIVASRVEEPTAETAADEAAPGNGAEITAEGAEVAAPEDADIAVAEEIPAAEERGAK